MARLSHTRSSRTVITIVVLAIAIAAAVEFHHTRHKQVAIVAPRPAQAAPAVAKPASPVVVTIAPPAAAVVKPLITETPDPRKPGITAPPTLWATNTASPAPTAAPAPASAAKAAPVVKLASDVEIPATSDLLAKSKAMVDAGDLLAARKMLNDALLTGSLSDIDSDAVKKQMADINQTVVFSSRHFPKDPLGGVYQVRAGEKLSSIGNSHSVPFEFLLMINNMNNARKLRYGQTLKVIDGPFDVVVIKSKFTLDLYLGSAGGPDSMYITTFRVGLGTDNSTPTGSWIIKNKVTHPAYFPPDGHPGGVLDPSDPKNPLGPCWMGLEGTDGQAVGAQSYGIHGTIDPNSIGKQSSMGCIRLHNEDVEVVYKMLVAGKSTVVVKN
jgi:LysM repeat protein